MEPFDISIISSPLNLTIVDYSSTMVQLEWMVTAVGGDQRYNVYCYHSNCPYCSHLPTVDIITTSSLMVTVDGLMSLTQYSCCVTAVEDNQESFCSQEVHFTTLHAGEYSFNIQVRNNYANNY